MKTLFVGATVLALVCGFGCTEDSTKDQGATAPAKSEQPAEPVKQVAKKPIAGEADRTFSLSVPFESVALVQGKEMPLLIGINRGENFREEVAIKVSDLPQGVTLETADPVIKTGETDVTLKLKADKDAALGDFTFKVTGHTASSGEDFSKDIQLTIAKDEGTQ